MTMRRFWNNRSACEVLGEMRDIIKISSCGVNTKAMLLELLEELQVMFNKMEAGLSDKRDLRSINAERSIAKTKLQELQQKVKDLGGTIDEE
jgi:hypothetical protein